MSAETVVPGETFEYSPKPLSVYEGAVWIKAPVTVADGVGAGATRLALVIRYQACNSSACLKPESITLFVPFLVESRPAEDVQ